MAYRTILLSTYICISLQCFSQECGFPRFDYSLKNVTDSNNLNVSFKVIWGCKYKTIYLDFGDGQNYVCELIKKTKCDSIVNHKYKHPGKYLIELGLGYEYKRGKQRFSSTKQYIDVSFDTTYFYYNIKNVSCDEYSVNFNNKSTSYDSLIWNFGDGSSSKEDNPTHNFNYFKDYSVILKAYRKGKICSYKKTIFNLSIDILITGKVVNFSKNKLKNILIDGLFTNEGKLVQPDINGNFAGYLKQSKNFTVIDTSNYYFPQRIEISPEQCHKYFEKNQSLFIADIVMDSARIAAEQVDYFTYKFMFPPHDLSSYFQSYWELDDDKINSFVHEGNNYVVKNTFDCSSKRYSSISFSFRINREYSYKSTYILDLYKGMYRGIVDSIANILIVSDTTSDKLSIDSINWYAGAIDTFNSVKEYESYKNRQANMIREKPLSPYVYIKLPDGTYKKETNDLRSICYQKYPRWCIPFILKKNLPTAEYYYRTILDIVAEFTGHRELILETICRIGNKNFELPKDVKELIKYVNLKNISNEQLIELIIALRGIHNYYTNFKIESTQTIFENSMASYIVSFVVQDEKYTGYVILDKNGMIDKIFIVSRWNKKFSNRIY